MTAVLVGASILVGCVGRIPAAASGPAGGSPPPSPSRLPSIAPTPRDTPSASPTTPPEELARLIGQKLIVRMAGTTASPELLGRIRRGEIGGVILFGGNIRSEAQVRALTRSLRDAADAGGQPRLLVAVDQEGGDIKRIPWAPPTLTPPEIGRDGRASVARSQGVATGKVLRALGIDVDLAPVADVPASDASFMARAGRTFSSDAAVTARSAGAFAEGLESARVLPAMKHFPGIGSVTADTDRNVVTVTASAADLEPGLEPYRSAIARGVPMIMLSNATYSAYDPDAAAGWSTAVGHDLLREELGFTGVTITDSLEGTAHARGVSATSLARLAATAGTDLLLLTGSEAATARVYAALLRDAGDGTIPLGVLRESDDRIRSLKDGLGD